MVKLFKSKYKRLIIGGALNEKHRKIFFTHTYYIPSPDRVWRNVEGAFQGEQIFRNIVATSNKFLGVKLEFIGYIRKDDNKIIFKEDVELFKKTNRNIIGSS